MEEIKDCILLNDLPSIEDTDVINEYIEELTRFHRRYLNVHASLKDASGTDEYMKVYQNFDVSSEVIAEIKKARLAKSRIKIEKEERLRKGQEAKEERIRKGQETKEERIRKEQEVKEERLRKERREELITQEEKEKRRSKEQEEKEHL